MSATPLTSVLRRRALAGLAAAGLVALSFPLAAAAAPTGDAPTIALFRAVSSNTNLQPAIQLTQTGYVSVAARATATTWSYAWGRGTVPSGSERAVETITYDQSQGRVVWLTDLLRPIPKTCTAGAACAADPKATPLELFVTPTVAFVGVVGAAGAVGCFTRVGLDTVPYRAGGHWWLAAGDFRPMTVHGNHVLITDTYAWPDGRHVTEVDSVDLTKRLFVASAIHVASGPTTPAFSIAQSDVVLRPAPHAPRVTRC